MKITFHGAAQHVTGSCHLIEFNSQRILFDCGFHQGGSDANQLNRRDFPFDPSSLDAVVLSHAHLDHTGLLPRLVREGYAGPIYATPTTMALLEILLGDSAYLQERDAERRTRWNRRKGKPPVEPIYTKEDVPPVMEQLREVRYENDQRILDEVVIRYHDAGHILGSAITEIELGSGGAMHRLVMSGDIGTCGAAFLRDPTFLEHAHTVVMESTYGDRDHRGRDESIAELTTVLKEAHADGGHVIIPAFAIGRTQELLYILSQLQCDGKLPQKRVIIDSPMAIKTTELYRKCRHLFDDETWARIESGCAPLEMDGLEFSRTADDSRAINELEESAVVISAAGMCTGGRILHHLKHNLWKPKARVVFVGFQAYGTPGRAIVDGADMVRIFREEIAVRCHVHTLGGFSAHAGRTELLKWHQHFKSTNPQTILVHGEPKAMNALADAIEAKRGRRPIMPQLGETITLEK